MQRIFFISVGVEAVLKILVGIKNLWQYTNCLEINLWRIFCRTFRSTQNSLESQCLVGDLVDFLELSLFLYLTYIIWLTG